MRGLAFAFGGALASGGVDGTLRLPDARRHAPLGRPLTHPGLVLGVAASGDGRHAGQRG